MLAVNSVSVDQVLSQKYVRHSLILAARLFQPFSVWNAVLPLTCAFQCLTAESCVGINFHTETMNCELFNKTGYFGEYLLTDSNGWQVNSNVMSKLSRVMRKPTFWFLT